MVYLTTEMVDQKISHTWMTKIQETIEGDEKRSALFTWPRIKLINKLSLIENEKQRFIYANLWRNIHNTWNIPIISDRAKLTSTATAAETIINVDETDYRHFYEGRECILISLTDWESYEVVTISGISATQITVSGSLSNTWPVDTNIYPIYECRVAEEQTRDSKFYKYNTIEIITKESFESTRDFTYTLPTVDNVVFPTYNSLDLFLYRPLNPIKEKYRHPYTLLEYYGKQLSFSTYGDTRAVLDRTFLCNSKKEIYDLLDFFDAKQGRLETFYTPSWLKDIVIDSEFTDAAELLIVKKLYLTEEELVGRHIYIRFKDGSYVCREIVSSPNELTIIIDSAIGTTVPAEDLPNMVCSFLYEVRFNVDEILLSYLVENIAKTKLGFNII